MTVSAALYIRLSREDDRDGPSESIQNQRSMLESYAAEHGFPIYDCFIDDGWSGTGFERPGFQRMLRAIEAGLVNLVLTKDLSRLGRDYILTGHYLERYFPEHGVRYISLLDGVDTGSDSACNDITPFRAVLNDLYARDISKKIKSVKRDKQKKGQFIGGKAVYGYRLHPTEKNRIVPDPPAAAVVRRIFAMALSGLSCRAMADALNREGVCSPAVYAGLSQVGAGLWRGERIAELLQNETYIGNLVQGRRVKVSYKSKKCLLQPKDAWAVVPGTHAPLVDRETFDAVQRLLQSRRRTRQRSYDPLFKGLLFCSQCGQPLGILNRRTKDGEDRLYYLCRTKRPESGEKACVGCCIREELVQTAVCAGIREICLPVLSRNTLILEAKALILEKTGDPQQEKRLLQQRLDRIYEDHLAGLLPEPDFRQRYADTRTRLDRLTALPEPDFDARATDLADRFLREFCSDRRVLTTLVRRMDLDKGHRLTVYLRCKAP